MNGMKEIQKVYVVTAGEYSDYHIECVTFDRKWAEARAKRCGGLVEEYNPDEERRLFTDMYRVSFTGFAMSCTKIVDKTSTEEIYGDADGVVVIVYAKDEEHAKKIAQDKRAEYLARVFGIE